MADKEDDYNDDYQFADLDEPGSGSFDSNDEEKVPEAPKRSGVEGRNRVIRNAIIAVIIFILAILLYTFFSAKKTQPTVKAPAKIAQAPVKPVVQPAIVQQPVQQAALPQAEMQTVEKKINALELNQQNIRSDVANLSNQLTTVNTNFSDISAQMTKLNQTIETLSATVSQQSNTIAVLEARLPKPKPRVKLKVREIIPVPIFYIQAVVPGRAWII